MTLDAGFVHMRGLGCIVFASALVAGCLGPADTDQPTKSSSPASSPATTTMSTSSTYDACSGNSNKDATSVSDADNAKVDHHTNIAVVECPYSSYAITLTIKPKDGEATLSATSGRASLARGDGSVVQQADVPASSAE